MLLKHLLATPLFISFASNTTVPNILHLPVMLLVIDNPSIFCTAICIFRWVWLLVVNDVS